MSTDTSLINTSYLSTQRNQNDSLVSYSGKIDSQTISALLTRVETNLKAINSTPDIKKKLLEISTELLQNIFHHGFGSRASGTHSFFLENIENGFMLSTSNLIDNEKVSTLENKLVYLNSCTNDTLKQLYQDSLRNGVLENGYAGLGLIDVRRKSANPILFKFVSMGNNYSSFTVKVLV